MKGPPTNWEGRVEQQSKDTVVVAYVKHNWRLQQQTMNKQITLGIPQSTSSRYTPASRTWVISREQH